MKKRIEWIDMLKGFGMILVMFAHAPLPDWLRKYIYSFHIPLFFFISGYLFNVKKYKNMKQFLKSKSLTLLFPYMVFSIVNYLFWLVFRKFANHGTDSLFTPLIGIFIGIRGTDWTLCNGTLWFVLALFIAELLLYIIISGNKKILIIELLIFSLIGYLYSLYVSVKLPWSIDVSLVAVVFLGLGYFIRTSSLLSRLNRVHMIIFFAINIICVYFNSPVDMYGGVYGNYFLFYIGAGSGIFVALILIRSLKNIKIINYVGQNSFVYLALHQYVVYSVLKKVFSKYITLNGNINILIAIIFVIVSLIVLYPIVYFTNKYFPESTGKKRTIRI